MSTPRPEKRNHHTVFLENADSDRGGPPDGAAEVRCRAIYLSMDDPGNPLAWQSEVWPSFMGREGIIEVRNAIRNSGIPKADVEVFMHKIDVLLEQENTRPKGEPFSDRDPVTEAAAELEREREEELAKLIEQGFWSRVKQRVGDLLLNGIAVWSLILASSVTTLRHTDPGSFTWYFTVLVLIGGGSVIGLEIAERREKKRKK